MGFGNMKNEKVQLVLGLVLLSFGVFFFRFPRAEAPDLPPPEDPFADQGQVVERGHPAGLRPASKAALFVSGGEEGQEWASLTPAAHRVRTVVPDAVLLAPVPSLKEGDRLDLALFDDAVLSAVLSDVTIYPNGAVGMTAQLEGDFKGTLFLSYSGGELRAHAEVLGGNDFYVRYDPEHQAHYAIEVNRSASDEQEGGDARRPAPAAAQSAPVAIDGAEPVEEDGSPPVAADAAADGVVVDVMIVYTPAALAYEGGLNGINNNIALVMQKANEAHGNSDTKVSLNLVHSAETTYTESGNAVNDLEILTFTGSTNSAMDEVQGWRDTYDADMVCLLESEPNTGGVGWLLSSTNGRPNYAYCLARVQQSDWTYTVAHEWGHNMGCSHSKTQANSPWKSDDLHAYSAGWQWSDTGASASVGYCSIMTYENFDGPVGDEYERAPHFSNPSIDYTDDSTNPTGHAADGDNARTIRDLRYVLADYRISSVPVADFPSSNSFEQAYSPWKYYGSDIDWERNSGATVSEGTGPSAAHDGSWYVYVEASGDGYPNKEAVLQAAFDFSAATDLFIDYAYHMYSADTGMGTLYLEASTNAGSSWVTHWTMSGNQGTTWFANRVDLSAYDGESNVELRFRGVTGSNFTSDMALDAIVVSGTASLDIDSDGMPNDWETLYFGGPTNALAMANPDFDTYNNLQEYIAGLNPTNSDGFGPSNFMVGASNAFEWNAASGRVYSVYWSSNLLDGFSILQSNLTSGAYTDSTHSAEAQGFYKLEVQLAP